MPFDPLALYDQEDCDICGEDLDGEVAEMHDPNDIDQSGIVHGQCGLDKGWEIS